MKKIEMVDLKGQYERIQQKVNQSLLNTIESTKFINGHQVKSFQEHLEEYLDVKHVIPCANGTDALQIALMSCDFEQKIENFLPYLNYDKIDLKKELQIIGTSGTVTTLGAVHLGLRRYDRLKVDGLNLSSSDINNVIKKFLFLGPEGRKKEPGIGRDRADLIMSGSAIMQTLMRIWPACSMKVADRGLREGILYSLMTADNLSLIHISEPTRLLSIS